MLERKSARWVHNPHVTCCYSFPSRVLPDRVDLSNEESEVTDLTGRYDKDTTTTSCLSQMIHKRKTSASADPTVYRTKHPGAD